MNKKLEEAKKQAERLKRAIAEGERLRLENDGAKVREFAEEAKAIAEGATAFAETGEPPLSGKRRRRVFTERRRGGKPKWKTELGYDLICAIDALTADGTSVLQACTQLNKWSNAIRHRYRKPQQITSDPAFIQFRERVGEHWDELREECWTPSPRALQTRYYDALKAWGDYFERERVLDAEMTAFRAMCNAAMAPPDATGKNPK